MQCFYRYYVRPSRVGARPTPALAIRRDEAASAPPAPDSQGAIAIDPSPHIAVARQYAW